MRRNRDVGALLALYLLWGTGCPAIKMCLEQGFGPFGLGTSRLLAASGLLLGVAGSLRRPLAREELLGILSTGGLFWVVANGLQVWGQVGVTAGMAALLLGTSPLIGALFERPSVPTLLGSGVSILGLSLAASGPLPFGPVLALVGSAAVAAWAGARSRELESDILWVAGLQLGVGGLGQGILMLVTGEPLTPIPSSAWLAWSWLVVGPAVLGMLAYAQAAKTLSLPLLLTYTVANPIVAMVVGWAFLSEPLGTWQIGGLVLVVAGLLPVLTVSGDPTSSLPRRPAFVRARVPRRS